MDEGDSRKPSACPICSAPVAEQKAPTSGYGDNYYACPNCGRFAIFRRDLISLTELDAKAKAILSAGIWQRQQGGKEPPIVHDTHVDAAKVGALPEPGEKLDLLVLFLGDQQDGSPGKIVALKPRDMRAKLGALTEDDVLFCTDAARKMGLTEGQIPPLSVGGRLTMDGWLHYQGLKRGRATGRTAFMAMSFRVPELTQIVDTVFRGAVEETGFRLKRLDDEPAAGSIDDRLRVEIRLCHFLIADLTCNNSGAYWEAGFAEGLGKPVIYTCNEAFFRDQGTHFDTNHHQTVLWSLDQPEKAGAGLKATIRATLPLEARMPSD